MLTIRLAMRSLVNRRLTTGLTIGSIALSVALLIGVETVRRGVRENFDGTIHGTDLIVGARGGSQQLLLSTIFGMGFPNGAITVETYRRWTEHPGVAWTVPISLGDSWHGFRVMGTNDDFYVHYHYRKGGTGAVTLAQGHFPASDSDVVLGSEVAKAAADQGAGAIGSKFIMTHGLSGTGISDHENHPFTVVGILNQTITPVDRTLFVTLDGVEGMHVGMPKAALPKPNLPGATPPAGATPPPAKAKAGSGQLARDAAPSAVQGSKTTSAKPELIQAGDHEDQLTAFLVGMQRKGGGMLLQREMNTDLAEPLTAIIPAVALTELWHIIEYAESGARVITFSVLLVGLMGMLVALYSTLQERRREMAILRSLGAGPGRIAVLLVFESGVLAFLGALTGLVLVYALLFSLGHIAETRFGIFIPITAPQKLEYIYLGGVVVAGILVGLIPAWRAYRNTLQDGLAIRL